MKLEKFGIYLADLNPGTGTEPGKIRPVVVVQTDLLNSIHSSTVICPLTSQVTRGAEPLRVYVSSKESLLGKDSDILVDQIRAIDNRRFIKKIGSLGSGCEEKLKQSLYVLLFE